MTFHLQVEALTSLAIDGSSTPTEDELSQFLKDGVLDVTNKWLLVNPREAMFFQRESANQTSNGVLGYIGRSNIISVIREANAANDWRNCVYIPPALQSRVTDPSSLYFASIYHPVYTIGSDGAISVFPAPDSGGVNDFKVQYINNIPTDDSDNNLAHSANAIKYFPNALIPLVVKYAAIKCLEAKISSFTIDDEDSELVSSLSNSYNALKADYDQMFGLQAQKSMESANVGTGQEQMQVPSNQGEEE